MPSRYRQETFHKLKWLCFWRLVLAVAGIAIVLLQESGRMTPRPALILLLGVCALDILYLAVLRLVRAVYEFTLIQIAVDILLVSALVYLTGCVKSNFTPSTSPVSWRRAPPSRCGSASSSPPSPRCSWRS